MTESTTSERNFAKTAVKLRKTVKANNPKFRRHESWRYKRLKENWRKPRGLDNKMRLKVKGWPKTVNIGYGGPRKAKGLHPSGYKEVLVHTPDEIVGIDPNTHAIRIAHSVGTRKRIQITSIAREKQIRILNPLVRRKVEGEEVEEELIEEAAEDTVKTEEEVEEKPAKRPVEKKSTRKPKKKPKRAQRKRKKEVKADES